ncbi:hypothetical protein BC834DRAFT_893508 [Gloeopeniophorella convolvens]|nr:hypothetical protein BC834DRAFT_893508 [Gloeopeniophorella convolvens]
MRPLFGVRPWIPDVCANSTIELAMQLHKAVLSLCMKRLVHVVLGDLYHPTVGPNDDTGSSVPMSQLTAGLNFDSPNEGDDVYLNQLMDGIIPLPPEEDCDLPHKATHPAVPWPEGRTSDDPLPTPSSFPQASVPPVPQGTPSSSIPYAASPLPEPLDPGLLSASRSFSSGSPPVAPGKACRGGSKKHEDVKDPKATERQERNRIAHDTELDHIYQLVREEGRKVPQYKKDYMRFVRECVVAKLAKLKQIIEELQGRLTAREQTINEQRGSITTLQLIVAEKNEEIRQLHQRLSSAVSRMSPSESSLDSTTAERGWDSAVFGSRSSLAGIVSGLFQENDDIDTLGHLLSRKKQERQR